MCSWWKSRLNEIYESDWKLNSMCLIRMFGAVWYTAWLTATHSVEAIRKVNIEGHWKMSVNNNCHLSRDPITDYELPTIHRLTPDFQIACFGLFFMDWIAVFSIVWFREFQNFISFDCINLKLLTTRISSRLPRVNVEILPNRFSDFTPSMTVKYD